MKKLLFFLIINFSFLIINPCKGQNPLVKQWDKRLGGPDTDWLSSIQQTTDGGFIFSGYSLSGIGGDKTQPLQGNYDFWIVKTDSLGNKQWDKDFGGADMDRLFSMQQTADGGFILGGASRSNISGDKTQNTWGGDDYWIVKIDSLGNKQWDKDFGGTNYEGLMSIQQTTDGGFILGGYSDSGISGDKTQANWGFTDYWIVKTDSFGNKQWDKDFGGILTDAAYSVKQTADGGFILGGTSYSGIGGDKTQNTWGGDDYWIVKMDSLGNKQWDKDFGGTSIEYLASMQQTEDDGFILGGYSFSEISGDKTQPNWDSTLHTGDYWIVKTDSLGNKQWDKDFGGTSWEAEIGNITQTSDGGYLVAGTSYSNISGDKTENNLGVQQTWVVKTDSIGNKQWDKTLLTDTTGQLHDRTSFAIQTRDGCYLMANFTHSGIGGDKTQANWDILCNPICTFDYWIIKFCDSTLTTSLTPNPSNGDGVEVYPNPFASQISFTIQKQNITEASFTLKNVLGQPVFSELENNHRSTYTKTVDLSFLSKGIYFLDIFIDGNRTVRKIVKE